MKNITILALATILAACGNDPITNAGYFDDDVDRSNNTTTNYTNDESNTSNSNNTTTNNYYHDSVIVVHDTLTRTITTRVTDTMYVKDTLTFTDTLTVHTSSTDTIVKNIKEVVRDTLRDTLKVTVRDTVRELRVDTIKEVITKTDTVRLLKRDTVKMMSTDYFDSLQALYDELPSYVGQISVGDFYIKYQNGYMTFFLHEDAPLKSGYNSVAATVYFIGSAVWSPSAYAYNENGYERSLSSYGSEDGVQKATFIGSFTNYRWLEKSEYNRFTDRCIIVTQVSIKLNFTSKNASADADFVWTGAQKLCDKRT